MFKIVIAAIFACFLYAPASAQQRWSSSELQEYVGEYALSDGAVLTISQRRHRLIAQLDQEQAVELTREGAATFVAHTGLLRIAFDQRRNGNVAGVTLSRDAAPTLARR